MRGDAIAEEMTVGGSLQANTSPTYQPYRAPTQRSEEGPISLKRSGLAMTERGIAQKENHSIWYLGIGLRPGFATDQDD
jgi:hypothetical protein